MTGPVLLSEADWLLARVATAQPADAAAAWRTWRATNDVDELSGHAYPFLVTIGARADAGLPDEEAGRLRGLHRRSWYVDQRLTSAARRSVDALTAAHVHVAMFGLLPLSSLDGHSGRLCSGVDLLVRPLDLAAAATALTSLGHRSVSSRRRRRSSVLVMVDHEGHHHRLHTQLPHVGALGRRTDGVWMRRATMPPDAHDLPSLSSADAVVLATAPRLGWVEPADALWPVDVHRLVQTHGNSEWWDQVVDAAAETPWGRHITEALHGCRARLGTDVPDRVLERLRALEGPGYRLRFERAARATRSRIRRRSTAAPLQRPPADA